MHERGKIRGRKYAAQVKDFTGLRWGKITPTDIDGLIDFGGKFIVVFELKYAGAEMPYGQRLALERLSSSSKTPMLVLVATHDTPPEEDIKVHAATVIEWYWNGKWDKPLETRSLYDCIEGARKRHAN